MADTLSNIEIPTKDWVDLYDLSGLQVGTRISVENISVCDIYLAVQETQPAVDHDSFTIIQRDNGLVFTTGPGAAGLWAFCNNDGAKVNVIFEGLVKDEPLTSFGERSVAENTPVAQISAEYGILEKAEPITILTGNVSPDGSLFVASTGIDPNAFALILTRHQVKYRPGQGLLGRVDAIFDTPQIDSNQEAGLIITTDRMCFGFNAAGVFGIIYKHNGEAEIQELTITTPATSSESATITVNGTALTVPLTAGTVNHNAFEISVSLNSQVADYDFSSNDNQVVARSLVAIPAGAFAFSSSTAVATWAQIEAGVEPLNSSIVQTDWNIDKRPDLDPFKGNVYQINYMGFGAIDFSIEDNETGKLVLVHRIKFANTSVIPSIGNPTFRVGWLTFNEGNTTSVSIKGSSAAGFIEGKVVHTEAPRADKNTNTSVPASPSSPVNLLTLRNRFVFGTRRNRAETFGISLTAATDSNKAVLVDVLTGAVISGDLDFQYIDKANSTTEVAKDGGEVTGGRLVASITIPPDGGEPFNLERLSSLILPGETVTISAVMVAGAASSVTVTIVFQEDL